MNAAFLKSLGRFGKAWLLLACLALVPLLVSGQQTTWNSSDYGSSFTSAPQINATNFYNSGTWNISTPTAPYKTANTLNYTNIASMSGSLGFEFDWGPTISGQRSMSANFVNNASAATITAVDGYVLTYPLGEVLQSYLLISATNIVNKGTLAAGASGEIILTGQDINLAHSGIEITPIAAVGSANNYALSNFTADTAIYDLLLVSDQWLQCWRVHLEWNQCDLHFNGPGQAYGLWAHGYLHPNQCHLCLYLR